MEDSMSEGKVCEGCGKVHRSRSGEARSVVASEEAFINENVEGLVEALKGLVLSEGGANPTLALAIAVGTAMKLAVDMRPMSMTQHDALRALAKDVGTMCEKHIARVEKSPTRKREMKRDHALRLKRMKEIEAMLEQTQGETELLVAEALGSA